MKSSPSIWHLLHNVKSKVKIFSNFVAFLQNINFNHSYKRMFKSRSKYENALKKDKFCLQMSLYAPTLHVCSQDFYAARNLRTSKSLIANRHYYTT